MPKATPEATQPPARELPPIKYTLSARQQREITRYSENFDVEASAVLKQIQARIAPAIEAEVAALASSSDAYEKAKADAERTIRAQILGTATASKAKADDGRPAVSLVGDDEPVRGSYTRTGT